MQALIIRPMEAKDWPAVAAIYEQGVASRKATFAQAIPTYEEWDSAHHRHSRLVAEQAGEVIGWVALTPSFARNVYAGVAEVSLYIHEKHQGKGIGGALLQAVEKESEENGIWTLEALIFDDNLPSLSLFQKYGYSLLGVRQKLGYDHALKKWRNVALLEKRSTHESFQ